MTARRPTDKSPERDALLMMLSAYLDGELSAADEARVMDALSQDEELLQAFEAMSAARVSSEALGLRPDEAQALTAAVVAATAPSETPATVDGALQLAQLALDGEGDHEQLQAARLDALLLEKPAFAPAVAGFVASAEAAHVAVSAVADVPAVRAGLRAVPDHVDAQVAARERLGLLASAALDDALLAPEAGELDALLAARASDADTVVALAASLHVGEALTSAAASPAFTRLAARAGAAALQVLDAEEAQRQAAAARPKPAPEAAAPSLLASLWAFLKGAGAPLGLAGAAAALFLLVQTGPASDKRDDQVASAQARKALFDALAKNVLDDTAPAGDLPLLADNSADVEAIDATSSTVVFSTESSNITVIWVADAGDAEQGT